MKLKRFHRCSDGATNQFLAWIEQGCFDALAKRYLKSIILAIIADTAAPDNALETYTLRVSYPDSALHQTIDSTMARLSLTRNEQPVLQVAEASGFRDAMSKILRTLCVLTQTLAALPARKYVSMKLTYYDEVTPADYEPPGFVAADFDLEHLFPGTGTSKFNFGRAATAYHQLALQMETVCDESGRLMRAGATGRGAESQASQAVHSFAESMTIAEGGAVGAGGTGDAGDTSQVAVAAGSPVEFPASEAIVGEEGRRVKCLCGGGQDAGRTGQESAEDVLQCHQCGTWQHTVCAGYVSARDKRLSQDSAYSCLACRYAGQAHTLAFVQSLCLYRSAINMLLGWRGNLITKRAMGEELGLGVPATDALTLRFREDGFVVAKKSKFYISPRTDAMKGRLKFYFHQDLTLHAGFREAQARDGAVTGTGTGTGVFMSQQPHVVSAPGLPSPAPTEGRVRGEKRVGEEASGGSPLAKKARKISVPAQRIPCTTAQP